MGAYCNYKYEFLAVSSKLDSTTLVTDSVNSTHLVSTASSYNLSPQT